MGLASAFFTVQKRCSKFPILVDWKAEGFHFMAHTAVGLQRAPALDHEESPPFEGGVLQIDFLELTLLRI